MKEHRWDNFYLVGVPSSLRIYDFQRRVYDIELDQVFDIWAFIHWNLDYPNEQWKDEILDYVFGYAPKPKLTLQNENGMITIYRGSGLLSQPPENALSWSSSPINAL